MVAARKGMISKGTIAARNSRKISRYLPLKYDLGTLQNKNIIIMVCCEKPIHGHSSNYCMIIKTYAIISFHTIEDVQEYSHSSLQLGSCIYIVAPALEVRLLKYNYAEQNLFLCLEVLKCTYILKQSTYDMQPHTHGTYTQCSHIP